MRRKGGTFTAVTSSRRGFLSHSAGGSRATGGQVDTHRQAGTEGAAYRAELRKPRAFRRRRLNVAPGPPSTRTMAAENGQADRAAASRLATPPRIKGAGLAALHRPRDRRRADRQRRKRLPPHVSETPRTPPTRTGNKHDRPR